MERPLPRSGDWVDTATVDRGRASTITTRRTRNGGPSTGHPWGPQLATSGYFSMATDNIPAELTQLRLTQHGGVPLDGSAHAPASSSRLPDTVHRCPPWTEPSTTWNEAYATGHPPPRAQGHDRLGLRC